MLRGIRKSKAQSVLEYTLILAAIIAAIIAAAPKVRAVVEKGFDNANTAMDKSTTKFKDLIGTNSNSESK